LYFIFLFYCIGNWIWY